MKILVVSHCPLAPTGYGRVTRWLVTQLCSRGWDVVCLGDGHLDSSSTEQLPFAVIPWRNLSPKSINTALANLKPDVLLTIGDPWMFEKVPTLSHRAGVTWIAYFPFDSGPMPLRYISWLKDVDKPIVFSRFARDVVCAAAGMQPEVIYHGVDVATFRPSDKHVAKSLTRLSGKFVVGTIARNQQRKNIPALINAFGKFAAGKEDVALYLHTQLEGTYNIKELSDRLGLSDKTRVTADITHAEGISDDMLVSVYNSMDVFVLPTMAEGFGLPIIEAQSCGVPALVTDYSACPELVPDSWQRLKVKDMLVMGQNLEHAIVDVDDIALKLEVLYRDRKRLLQMGQTCHQFAQRFKWENVINPLLELIDSSPTWTEVEPEPIGLRSTTRNGINEQNAQERFSKAAASVSAYPNGYSGRGIVVVGGGIRYFPCAWVCIRMLRELRCTLPIELWHLGEAEMTPQMRALIEPFGVRCVEGQAVAARSGFNSIDGWELKVVALLRSRFREVLLLDADNFPILNPDFLFETKLYEASGAVFWPDLENLHDDDPIWELTGLPFTEEPAFESGQILVDKSRCWEPLQLAVWMNQNSDFWYRYLLGDKDTFHLAWKKLGQTYSMISHPVHNLDYAMCQHDPEGRRILQHRNRAKWRIDGWNPKIADFRLEEKGFEFLQELQQCWRPVINTADEVATFRIQQAWEKYKRNETQLAAKMISLSISDSDAWEMIGIVAEHTKVCAVDATTIFYLRRAIEAAPNVVELKQMLKGALTMLGRKAAAARVFDLNAV